MAKWYCKLEIKEIIEAETEEQARSEFAFAYQYFPSVMQRAEDDASPDRKWRDRSFTIDSKTGAVTYADPEWGIMEEARKRCELWARETGASEPAPVQD
jgi:hypothetical protein